MLNSNVQQNKKDLLRQQMRGENRLHSLDEKVLLSRSICEKIERIASFHTSLHTLFFYPLNEEPNVFPLLTKYKRERYCYLPRMKGEDLEIVPYRGEEEMYEARFGIREPKGEALKDTSLIDCVLVPAMGFDVTGDRLGHGKGFYDRLLGKLPSVFSLGVCFPWNILANIPTEEHDKKVHTLVY